VETLELLEEQLAEFQGTVIVISHDREFLDNVVTDTVFLDGSGKVEEFVGGYSDWRRQGGRFPSEAGAGVKTARQNRQGPAGKPEPDAKAAAQPAKAKPAKLSYKLKLELEQLPVQIEALEQEIASLQSTISEPDFYSGPQDKVSSTLASLAEKEAALEKVIERWMELEEQAGQ